MESVADVDTIGLLKAGVVEVMGRVIPGGAVVVTVANGALSAVLEPAMLFHYSRSRRLPQSAGAVGVGARRELTPASSLGLISAPYGRDRGPCRASP